MRYIGFALRQGRHQEIQLMMPAAVHLNAPNSIAIGRRSQRKQRPIRPRFVNRARE